MEPNRIELYSPLSHDECVSLIYASIDRENFALISFSSFFGSKPVLGRVTESSLFIRKRIRYGNSFQTFLSATIRAEGDGTAIIGKFGVHPFVRIVVPLWFGGVILIGGTIFVSIVAALISGTAHAEDGSLVLVLILIMLAFGIGLVRFCRYLARDEAKFIKDFLVQLLRAKPSETRSV